jgi:cytochrome b561
MSGAERFPATSRWLHWSMAAMIIAMLFIGIGMAATVSRRYEILVSIHRPLGIAILIFALVRLVNRMVNPPPQLPPSVPTLQRIAAVGSHYLLYALMLILPLVGWAMLSAAPYPIVTYARLRGLHTALALLFFATILLHFGAALFHALIRRDGVFESMASWRRTKQGPEDSRP